MAGIGLGVGGWWIPGSSEKHPRSKLTFFLFLIDSENIINIVFYKDLSFNFLIRFLFLYCICKWRAP